MTGFTVYFNNDIRIKVAEITIAQEVDFSFHHSDKSLEVLHLI